MNYAAAPKTPEIILTKRLLALRLLSIRLPAQDRINRTQLLNVSGVLLDDLVSLTAESWRLKILPMLNNPCGHLLCQDGVMIVQHGECFLMLVFWCAHNQVRQECLTTKLTDRHDLTYENQKLQGKSPGAIGGSVQRFDTPIKALVGLC